MVVNRKSFNLHWLSSILLVGFAGVLYRFRGAQHKLTNITLQHFIGRFWYKPQWMLKMQRVKQPKFSFDQKQYSQKQKAQYELAVRDYRWYKKLAKIIY